MPALLLPVPFWGCESTPFLRETPQAEWLPWGWLCPLPGSEGPHSPPRGLGTRQNTGMQVVVGPTKPDTVMTATWFCKDLYWVVPSRAGDKRPRGCGQHCFRLPTPQQKGLRPDMPGCPPRAARSLLQGRIVEQLLDEVHVGQQHAAAAVALQAQRVQGVPAGRRGRKISLDSHLGPVPSQ